MPSSPLESTQSDKIRCGMPSCPLGSTHGRTMLAIAMPSSPLAQSDYVVCGTPSSPLDSVHKIGRRRKNVACHHLPWTTYTVRRPRAWHVIIALGLHTRLDDFGRGNATISLGLHTLSYIVGCCMPSSPLENKPGRMTSVVKCHQFPLTTYTIGLRRAWHIIISLG